MFNEYFERARRCTNWPFGNIPPKENFKALREWFFKQDLDTVGRSAWLGILIVRRRSVDGQDVTKGVVSSFLSFFFRVVHRHGFVGLLRRTFPHNAMKWLRVPAKYLYLTVRNWFGNACLTSRARVRYLKFSH